MSGAVLIAILVDLQSFGLFNEILGPRLADLILSVIMAGLHARIEAMGATEASLFEAMLFGDEFYFFARVGPDAARRLADRAEREVMSLQAQLQGAYLPVLVEPGSGFVGPDVPSELRDKLSKLGVLAAPVCRPGELEGLALLPRGRTLSDLNQELAAALGEEMRVIEHPASVAVREVGLDRPPLPGLRLGCGLFTLDGSGGELNDGLDFAMQELNAELARARRSNRGVFRLEMPCGAPRVKSRDLFPPAEPPLPDYLLKLEHRVARERLGEGVWQVVICRIRWRAADLGGRGDELWSLGDLISHTNPRVGELVIQNQARWFWRWWAERFAGPVSPDGRPLCGMFGACLALVLVGTALDETSLRRHLHEFVTHCREPALISLARIDAIVCVGRGTDDLLDVLSLGPSFLSWGWNAGSMELIDLTSISVDHLWSFRRIAASRRVPNLSALLASRGRGLRLECYCHRAQRKPIDASYLEGFLTKP